MVKITDRCPADHPCPLVGKCPEKAILQPGRTGFPVIEQEKCIECGICVDNCPLGAVEQK